MPFSDAYALFKATRYGMIFTLICLLIASLESEWMSAPALVLSIFIAWERSQCAYVSNSYSRFCIQLITYLFSMDVFIFGAHTYTLASAKWGWILGTLVFFSAQLLTGMTYVLASRLKLKTLPYEIRDGRVHVTSRRSRYVSPVWVGFCTLGSGAVGQLLTEYPTATLVMCIVLPSIVIISIWRTVAGLAHLRAEERRKGVRYTFSNLEEIQAIRARSWAARLFIAFNNLVSRQR
ncbi:hypothetical protein K8374_14555 [Pseudomonas sp. p1(2021b)]|uniref:hypothetical protein n=1 Tax=Pseudomonas sp. p1(2021b) TaxID=2874628 RepID=UPI001CCE078D|nr:hypothetical protein [Pseudomonas sp. p1(2021b)]UBM23616.1 hypothetical protein K8374_14555 [Pseudomonas sp. p1(2021b)]